jgi:fumarylpyruvate hydrolase
MNTLFPPQPPILAATATGAAFPVRRVFCIGANYAAHAREMGRDPDRDPPFFFTKWAEAVVPDGAEIAYPPQTANYHYEAEMVVALGRGEHVWGFAAGLDMTRRDLQFAAREAGRPWDVAKNFEQAAPLGTIHPIAETGPMSAGAIRLTVNGQVKQDACVSQLTWSVPELIATLSRFYRLEAGDLIFTGTPAGVAPVEPGDRLEVSIAGLSQLRVRIGPPGGA